MVVRTIVLRTGIDHSFLPLKARQQAKRKQSNRHRAEEVWDRLSLSFFKMKTNKRKRRKETEKIKDDKKKSKRTEREQELVTPSLLTGQRKNEKGCFTA
jgi:hypothetical protein